ncbi:tyrosine-type recombinase/integrase [Listeria fleischmannii]|uniref:tyrosine-type recombinase/integrase n=1 Tax=Listeria fleischmannii TaxID=1069827 RepID=UPI001624ADB2|nr:site-specific integrase [Listeria fleischmannii]MBC1418484.1 site-specific integrase [Listeria fleischmannii]
MKIIKNSKGYTTTVGIKKNGKWTTKRVTEATKPKLRMTVAKLLEVSNRNEIPIDDYKLFEFIELFYDTFKVNTIGASTQNSYENAFREIKEYFGNIILQKITPIEYQKFINTFGKNLARSTVETRNKKIRAMFNKAVQLGYMRANPTHGIILAGKDVASLKLQFIDTSLISPLIEEITTSYSISRAVNFIALQTGMRFGEIVGLTWYDIDLDNKFINVKNAWDYKDTQNFISTKGKDRRKIFIDSSTVEYLEGYRKWLERFMKKNKIQNKYLLLFCSRNNLPVDNQACNKVLKKCFNKISNEDITLHKLRHTHTVQCLESGMDIIYVSERLGHADINTTLKYYTHISSHIRAINEKRTQEYFKRRIKLLEM